MQARSSPRWNFVVMSTLQIDPTDPRFAVVVNGNAKGVNRRVISSLDRALHTDDLFLSRRPEDSPRIVRTVVDRGYGTVLTGGGDGTFTFLVTEFLKEAERQNRPMPRFAPLKLGTGNSLAWTMGVRGKTGKALADDVQRLGTHPLSKSKRLVQVEGYQTPFCGLGLDADVLADYTAVKRRLAATPLRPISQGILSYFVGAIGGTLPKKLASESQRCRVVNRGSPAQRIGAGGVPVGAPVRRGDLIYEGPALVASVSTIPCYGFGIRVFPHAEAHADRMQLRIANMSPVSVLTNLPGIWTGEYANLDQLYDYWVDDVEIEMLPSASLQIGGDAHGKRQTLRASLAQKPIQLVGVSLAQSLTQH